MNDWAQSKNIIIFYYPGYTGGKFIINCLGFNDHCHPSLPTTENKIERLFATIPPSKEACRTWTKYELSCGNFWGTNLDQTISQQRYLQPHPRPNILNDNYCFFVTHTEATVLAARQHLPNAQVVQLINFMQFYRVAVELKSSYVPIEEGRRIGDYYFNVDTIFEWDQFYAELVKCAEYLNIEPVFDHRLKEFYQQYISLHR